jgi:hypothetical protein
MEEKLLLTLVDNRRLLNENFDNFPIKMLIIREIFDISDISNELLRILLFVCGIDEDDIILKLYTSIDNTYIINDQFFGLVYFKDLDLKSITCLCKIDVYFLQEIGFNIKYHFDEYNIKIKIIDPEFSKENYSFQLLLKNKVKFGLITIRLQNQRAYGYQTLIGGAVGVSNVAVGVSALINNTGTKNFITNNRL